MPKPPGPLVVKWRDLAAEGWSYAEIARRYSKYSADQVRHYCLGTSGKKLPGPLQKPGRWNGRNVWLQGEKSPHAELTREQALAVLDDWDEERDRWGTSGTEWARILKVSASTIHMLRRGETWQHLEHPNQGRRPGKGPRKSASRSKARGAAKAASGASAKKAPARKKAGGKKASAKKASRKTTKGASKSRKRR